MTNKFRNISDIIPRFIFGSIAALTVIILISIFLFLYIIGMGTFHSISLQDFLFGIDWNPTSYHTPAFGILSIFVSTLMVSFLSLLIAVPFGLSIAIYLSEIASPTAREVLKPVI